MAACPALPLLLKSRSTTGRVWPLQVSAVCRAVAAGSAARVLAAAMTRRGPSGRAERGLSGCDCG